MRKGKNFIARLALMALTIFPCLNYATEIDGPWVPSEGYPVESPTGMNGCSEKYHCNYLFTLKTDTDQLLHQIKLLWGYDFKILLIVWNDKEKCWLIDYTYDF